MSKLYELITDEYVVAIVSKRDKGGKAIRFKVVASVGSYDEAVLCRDTRIAEDIIIVPPFTANTAHPAEMVDFWRCVYGT